MTRRDGSLLWLVGMLIFTACGDDSEPGAAGAGGADTSSSTSESTTATSTGSTAEATTVAGSGSTSEATAVTGTGGGAPVCTGILTPDGIGDLHGTACIACIEDNCCGALAACAADDLCSTCLGDPSTAGCTENAAVLDLVVCASNGCNGTACIQVEGMCTDDGICDAGFMGHEQCACADCLVEPVDEDCTGAVCDLDGECDGTDACTCEDCADDCTVCNLDGFCDTYLEPCACADCDGAPACAGAGE